MSASVYEASALPCVSSTFTATGAPFQKTRLCGAYRTPERSLQALSMRTHHSTRPTCHFGIHERSRRRLRGRPTSTFFGPLPARCEGPLGAPHTAPSGALHDDLYALYHRLAQSLRARQHRPTFHPGSARPGRVVRCDQQCGPVNPQRSDMVLECRPGHLGPPGEDHRHGLRRRCAQPPEDPRHRFPDPPGPAPPMAFAPAHGTTSSVTSTTRATSIPAGSGTAVVTIDWPVGSSCTRA